VLKTHITRPSIFVSSQPFLFSLFTFLPFFTYTPFHSHIHSLSLDSIYVLVTFLYRSNGHGTCCQVGGLPSHFYSTRVSSCLVRICDAQLKYSDIWPSVLLLTGVATSKAFPNFDDPPRLTISGSVRHCLHGNKSRHQLDYHHRTRHHRVSLLCRSVVRKAYHQISRGFLQDQQLLWTVVGR
jgi:hypothetical protein